MKIRPIFYALLGLVCFQCPSFAQTAVDLGFDSGTGANAFIESTVVQPDGRLLVCGLFTSINGVSRSYIARLKADGSVDPTFTANPNYWVRFMALQTDGKVVIGGFFTGVNGVSRNGVARLNDDGSLDSTFDPGTGCTGRIVEVDPTQPFLFAIAEQKDGKIIIAGNFTNYNGVARSGIARLNHDGSLDTGFQVGSGFNSWGRSILILPNDQIMVSGWFENYDNRTHNRIVRLNPDGSADPDFNPWFGYSTSIYSMARQSDGKLVVGGHSVNTNAPFRQEIVRLLSDGSYDPTFNRGGDGANDKVESVVLQLDGKILIGGYFNSYNNARLGGFARLNSDGSLDSSLSASADNWIWTIALQSNKQILICGAFSSINGLSRNGIARLNPTNTGTSPQPQPSPTPVAGATNSFEVWLLGATNVTNSVSIPPFGTATNTAWQMKAVGDINKDGQPDFIFQNTNGSMAAWIMNGTAVQEFRILRKQFSLWKVIGASDLNSDAQTDLFLRDRKGRLAIMFFKKTKFTGATLLPRKLVIPETWRLVGFNDFDGDLKTDILWQDTEGRLVVWFMNGKKYLRSTYLDEGRPLATDWRPVAVGDIDGDQQKDILFQHADGKVAIWSMTSTNVVSSSELFPNRPIQAGWKIRGLADLNKDGRADLIWQNAQ